MTGKGNIADLFGRIVFHMDTPFLSVPLFQMGNPVFGMIILYLFYNYNSLLVIFQRFFGLSPYPTKPAGKTASGFFSIDRLR